MLSEIETCVLNISRSEKLIVDHSQLKLRTMGDQTEPRDLSDQSFKYAQAFLEHLKKLALYPTEVL
jgi:hypothetical protein